MKPEELESIKSQVSIEMQAFSENIKGYVKESDLTARLETFENAIKSIKAPELTAKLDEVKRSVEAQAELISKMQGNGGTKNTKELRAYANENAAKAVQAFKNRTMHEFSIENSVSRASVINSTQAMRLPDISELPYKGHLIRQALNTKGVTPDSNGIIRYVDQLAVTRNAIATAEGGNSAEAAITWQEYTLNLEKITNYIITTMEAMSDVLMMEAELKRLLEINMADKEDTDLWSGNGTTPNIKGLYTYGTAVTASNLGAAVKAANLYDLVGKIKTFISNGKQSKFMPDKVFINPETMDILRYEKDEMGRYLFDLGINTIAGLQVIETSTATANTMLVCDSRHAELYVQDEITIQAGYINDQMIKGLMTMYATMREGLLVRNTNLGAFAKVTDVAQLITDITA